SYRPWLDKQIDGSYIDWNLGAEYKRLGTFFRSPANPGAVADRQVERLFSDLVWGEWGLQAALAQERDNVEGIAALPRIRTRHGGFNLNYTPAPAYDAQGVPETGWLGQPSYSLTANLQTQRTDAVADPDPGDWLDTETRVLGFNANFSYSDWSWGIDHTWSRIHDDSLASGVPTSNETRSVSTGLNASFTLLQDYTVSPRIAWDETRYYDLGYTDKGLLWGLGVDAAFIPGELSGRFNYDESRARLSDGSSDNKSRHLGLSLSWVALPERQSRPGVTWVLSGDYNDYTDDLSSANDTDSYQLFLKLLIGWSASY
ncbi:MAG: hypothetical protein B0D88_09460, partial [Candidatus Sedimenticola endophacoides]